MMLKPDTPESRLLVDWVEGGECLIAAQLLTHFANCYSPPQQSCCLPAI